MLPSNLYSYDIYRGYTAYNIRQHRKKTINTITVGHNIRTAKVVR